MSSPLQGLLRHLASLEERRRHGVGLAVLIGEAPNRATVRRPELWLRPDHSGIHHTANRLRDWSGLSTPQFLRCFDRTNVLEEPVETWPAAVARDRASELWRELRGRAVVLLGRRAGDAFGLSGERFPGWYEWAVASDGGELERLEDWRSSSAADFVASPPAPIDVEALEVIAREGRWLVAVAPHPSTRSRRWNDPVEVQLARSFWTSTGRALLAWREVLRVPTSGV